MCPVISRLWLHALSAVQLNCLELAHKPAHKIGTQRFGFGGANRANSRGTTNGPASRQLRPSEPEFRTGEQQSVGRPDRGATFQIHFSFPVCKTLSTRDESGQAEDQCRHSRPIGWRRRYYVRFFRRFMAGLFNRDQASGSEPALRSMVQWLDS
jgi:hypothetical protein